MPLITVTFRKGHSVKFKQDLLAAIHAAIVTHGVPSEDKFQRILELDADNFSYDATYPDLSTPRTENFILIEILLSVGRSVKIKKQIVATLIANLTQNLKVNSEEVMIVFNETRWENWSFGGGRFIHV